MADALSAVLDGPPDMSDSIIAALEGPRGPEIAALVLSRACAVQAVGISTVQATVAKHYGVTVGELRDACRHRSIAGPRSVAVYLARTLTGASYPELGAAFCRDHTTVRAAYLRIERKIQTDEDLHDVVTSLRKVLARRNIAQSSKLGTA